MIGMIATINTPNGEPITLAYEPTPVYKFAPLGLSKIKIIAISVGGLFAVIALGILVVYLRRKSLRLNRRLEYEVENSSGGGQEL